MANKITYKDLAFLYYDLSSFDPGTVRNSLEQSEGDPDKLSVLLKAMTLDLYKNNQGLSIRSLAVLDNMDFLALANYILEFEQIAALLFKS